MSVAERLNKIQIRMGAACARSGRDPLSVRLLAVSKLQSVAAIREAYDAGQKDFAENYVQEAEEKMEQLANLPVNWHFIGRIQSNKVKLLAGKFRLLHSVDRMSIVEGLHRLGRPQEILLQYDVAGEESKGGATSLELEKILSFLSREKSSVVARGLMAMPPFAENPEDVRPYFRKTRELAMALGLPELSMGTTQDFEVAIEEGATWIRIGTDVFGPREVEK